MKKIVFFILLAAAFNAGSLKAQEYSTEKAYSEGSKKQPDDKMASDLNKIFADKMKDAERKVVVETKVSPCACQCPPPGMAN